MKGKNELYFVFVGVNEKNEDIELEDDPAKNVLVDDAKRCPPFCTEDSRLIK